MDFLVRIEVHLPADLPEQRRSELLAAEAVRGRELVAAGTLARIWRLPGRQANVGIWAARDATALHDALVSLPLWPWMTVSVEALATHSLDA